MSDTTIIVPCYNEAERLDVEAFLKFAAAEGRVRFLFVDDGSADGTRRVIERLCRADRRHFTLHALPENSGKAEAVRQGILLAIERGAAAVGYWDADLATPLDEIPRFLDSLRNDPRRRMVLGARIRLLGRSIERRPLRQFLGRAFATVASAVLRLPIYDTQCGAKLFLVTDELRQAFAQPFRSNWIFDVEVVARLILLWPDGRQAAMEGAICELPLGRWRDVAGSKVRPTDFLRAVGELADIYWSYVRRGGAADYRLSSVRQAEPRVVPSDARRRAA
ncbi:MAG: glycosyltransferase [Pirellulales bacterium]